MPRCPIFIPSKGRYDHNTALTARTLSKDGVPFTLVVERAEAELYTERFGEDRVAVLPDEIAGTGSSVPARNHLWALAEKQGAARHWCLDDNLRDFRRMWKRKRIPCHAGLALRACEDFADRYENVAIAGLNYMMFSMPDKNTPPFRLNCHVYSCMLIDTALPFRWRGIRNEDTDLCLQALSSGLCTI
jgi:hypothetical protein